MNFFVIMISKLTNSPVINYTFSCQCAHVNEDEWVLLMTHQHN